MGTEKADKVIIVDEETCIGCGTCEGIAPEYFKIEDGVSKVVAPYSEADAEVIEEAINNCPVQAISLQTKTEKK